MHITMSCILYKLVTLVYKPATLTTVCSKKLSLDFMLLSFSFNGINHSKVPTKCL